MDLFIAKSDAYQYFINFYAMIFNQFDDIIKKVCSDNAQEFIAGLLKSFLLEYGIIFQTSYVGTP